MSCSPRPVHTWYTRDCFRSQTNRSGQVQSFQRPSCQATMRALLLLLEKNHPRHLAYGLGVLPPPPFFFSLSLIARTRLAHKVSLRLGGAKSIQCTRASVRGAGMFNFFMENKKGLAERRNITMPPPSATTEWGCSAWEEVSSTLHLGRRVDIHRLKMGLGEICIANPLEEADIICTPRRLGAL